MVLHTIRLHRPQLPVKQEPTSDVGSCDMLVCATQAWLEWLAVGPSIVMKHVLFQAASCSEVHCCRIVWWCIKRQLHVETARVFALPTLLCFKTCVQGSVVIPLCCVLKPLISTQLCTVAVFANG